MYDELVKRLRTICPEDYVHPMDFAYGVQQAMCEAADAIEELNRKVEELEAMREISPEAEYAINKHADNIISKLDKLINSPNTDNLLKENEALKKELAQYKGAEEKGYIITPPDSGINVYIIDKNGNIIM